MSDWFHTTQNSVGQAENLPLSFTNLTGGVLYGWLVCRGKPTYASSGLIVEFEVRQGVSARTAAVLLSEAPVFPPLTGLTITRGAELSHDPLEIHFDAAGQFAGEHGSRDRELPAERPLGRVSSGTA